MTLHPRLTAKVARCAMRLKHKRKPFLSFLYLMQSTMNNKDNAPKKTTSSINIVSKK